MDLSFFRTILEVFIRPVDGTLKIKSHTYVLIEAGKGSAEVGYNEFNHIEREKKRSKWSNNKNHLYKGLFLGQLEKTIDFMTGKIDTIVDNIQNAQRDLVTAIGDYENLSVENFNCYNQLDNKMKFGGENDIIHHVHNQVAEKDFNIVEVIKDSDFGFDDKNDFKYELTADEKEPIKPEDGERPERFRARKDEYNRKKESDDKKKVRREKVLEKAREVGTKYKLLYDAVKAWKDFDYTKKEKKLYFYTESLRNSFRNLTFFDTYRDDVIGGTIDRDQAFLNIGNVKLKLRRKIVYELIVAAADDANAFFGLNGGNEPADYANADNWTDFKDRIVAPGKDGKIPSPNAALKFLNSYFIQGRISEWRDMIGNPLKNKFKWSAPEENGKILLSDTAGKTLHLSSGGNGVLPAVTDNLQVPNQEYINELKEKVNAVN
jgi:hypothetical protein